ncbi:hypothetical protein AruPA_05970 [Acidiphilium sp. PA]|uniref:hypothetical protein n=1 Tax=Acidiphilium sp. PA TaxID=2871705 RepID=UPI0022442589|nr:hypothetical protein [Acidiphilium sp. PA]MCW8306576.1 hypothetical protein [Acidiphilium sp. PA]
MSSNARAEISVAASARRNQGVLPAGGLHTDDHSIAKTCVQAGLIATFANNKFFQESR